jgi:cell division protein FtsI/penicillin-binding protein 2
MLRSNQIQWMRAVICFLIGGFLILSGRLTYIQAYRHDKYKGISEGRVNRTEFFSPRRGEIRDVNGNQLAVTRDVRTVVLDPGLLASVDPVTRREYLDLVSSLLHLDRGYLNEKSRSQF